MRTPYQVIASEFAGTAVLVAVGLSFVIADFGSGSIVSHWMPQPWLRRALTGLLFGATGGLLALSPVGRVSGAHINPIVTLAFWWRGTLEGRHVPAYVGAQLLGAVAGALPLLLWGHVGASVHFGATDPGRWGAWAAAGGEVVTTFALVAGLLAFTGHRSLRPYTPFFLPVLYALMVGLEAPVSGTSTNPARSIGPAVIAWHWPGFWVYLLGPVLGAVLAVAAFRSHPLRLFESEVAKLYHFELDLHGIFRKHA